MDTSARHTVHPLVAALSHSRTVDTEAYADIGALEASWFTAVGLCDAQTILLDDALTRQAKHYPHMEARTRGAYFIGEYSWYMPQAAIGAYLLRKRVPDLSAENIALRYSTYTWHEDSESGEAERIDVRFLSGRFACLPDDPTADHPDAIVLPDRDALREWLRTTLEAHLTPLIERVYARTKLSRHAQWMLVADSCAALFLHSGQALGNEAHAKAEGMAFVKAPGSPMNNNKTSYISLQYLNHCETFRARGGCCRYYTVSETGKDYCSTCVLRKPADRDARLLAYMQKKYAEASI
jgi:hypothetical protein